MEVLRPSVLVLEFDLVLVVDFIPPSTTTTTDYIFFTHNSNKIESCWQTVIA